eukprot:INCI19249.1.p1 GENE.INCI19249.1~~INCI19249.1.p1  ORF type:complete len:147 (-),score=27.64 INCI19249.1:195-635(-)
MADAAVFMMVSDTDFPVFEAYFQGYATQSELVKNQKDYILYSALDMVDNELLLSTKNYYEELDSFNEWKISAFVSPGQTKYLLMHRNECREGISAFFKEVHQHYVETVLNPFYRLGTVITTPVFARSVNRSARKWLEGGTRRSSVT